MPDFHWISGLFLWSLTDHNGVLLDQTLCVPDDGGDTWTDRMQGIAQIKVSDNRKHGTPYYGTFVQSGPGPTGSGNFVSMRCADTDDLTTLLRHWDCDITPGDWVGEVSRMGLASVGVKTAVAQAVAEEP
ncbi:MAG: hypothetical protein Q7S48_02780 [bacterium]|nr:hypothetical protein [bacterium]